MVNGITFYDITSSRRKADLYRHELLLAFIKLELTQISKSEAYLCLHSHFNRKHTASQNRSHLSTRSLANTYRSSHTSHKISRKQQLPCSQQPDFVSKMANIVDKAKDALHMNNKNSNEIKIAGEKVHHTGYGLMGLTWRKNPPSQEQSFEAMSMFFLPQ